MRARPHGSCADRLSPRGRRDQSSRSGLQAVLQRPTLHRTLRPTKTRSGSPTAARFAPEGSHPPRIVSPRDRSPKRAVPESTPTPMRQTRWEQP